jgi:hypothetical protein
MEREEALAHFGVKGMRWGVRRNSRTGFLKTVRGPYKAKKIPKEELTLMQRRTATLLIRAHDIGKSRKQIKKGEKAAAAMVRRHGGMKLGSAWYPDKRMLEKLEDKQPS